MKVGTKSLLFGAHLWWLHPIFLAVAWWQHYRHFEGGWRLFFCFLVHDWGYWGSPDMDGPIGKLHPMKGARIAAWVCSRGYPLRSQSIQYHYWYEFCACHSRYHAERLNMQPSPLMVADKWATCLYPRWLYWILLWLSGEGKEYMAYHETATGVGAVSLWDYTKILQDDWARFAPGVYDYGREG